MLFWGFFTRKKKKLDIETLKKELTKSNLIIQCGLIDQLEDRIACTDEATGSSPVQSTIFLLIY